jgi:hypothetical protein
MAECHNNPFDADWLPFSLDGLFEALPGSSSSPELDRLSAFLAMSTTIQGAGADQKPVPEFDRAAALRAIVMPMIEKLSTAPCEAYIAALPSPIRTAMDQKYGKPDANHVFTNDKMLRHVLFPLFCSGFLDTKDHMRLLVAEPLRYLIRDYIEIDFTPLRIQYGNHPLLSLEPEKTQAAVVKDASPGWISFFDRRMLLFTLNAHVSPLGITDLNHPS